MEDMGLLIELAEEVAELRARVAALEETTKGTPRFTPPTLEEVFDVMVAYCEEKNFRTDANPREFVDFYESNGWKVGRVKMRNWERLSMKALI